MTAIPEIIMCNPTPGGSCCWSCHRSKTFTDIEDAAGNRVGRACCSMIGDIRLEAAKQHTLAVNE